MHHQNLFEELKRISVQLSQCPQPLGSANAEIIYTTLITSVLPTAKQDQIQQLESLLNYLKQKNLTKGGNDKSSAKKKNFHSDKFEDTKGTESAVGEEKPLSLDLIEDLLFLRASYLLVTRIMRQYDVDVVDSTGTHHHHSSSNVGHLDQLNSVINEFLDAFTKLLQSDPDYFISHSSVGAPSSISPFHLVCSYMADVTFNPLNGPTPPPSPSVESKHGHKHHKKYNLKVLQLCVSEWNEFLKNQETSTISFSTLCLLTLELIRKYPKSNVEQFAEFSEEIFNYLATVIYSEDPLCRKAVINVLLPSITFLHRQHSNKKKALWEHVVKMYQGEAHLKPSAYELLCQLYDWLSDGHFGSNSLDVRLEPLFWKIVQEGLLDKDSIIRKQSVWILKRTIAVTKMNQSPDYTTKTWINVFWWKPELSDDLTSQWDMFFLIYDTFNEYNLHLIKPVWSQLELLHAALDGPAFLPDPTPPPSTSKGKKQTAANKIKGTEIAKTHLDISWIYILYQNGLTSDNPTIRKWILLSILDSDKKLRFSKEFIFKNMLPSMPSPFFRGATGPQADKAVQKFFTNYILNSKTLPEKVQRTQDILGALCQSDKVNLSVAAFLTILNAFSQLPEIPAINSDILNSLAVLCDLRLAKLHHIFRPKAYAHLTVILYNLTDYTQVEFINVVTLIKYYPVTESQIGSNRAILSAWFDKFEVIKQGGSSLNTAQPWLHENLKNIIQDFSTPAPVDQNSTAADVAQYPLRASQLMRVLTFVRNPATLLEIIQPVFEQLNQIYSHSYMRPGHPEKLLAFLAELLSNITLVQALGTQLFQKASECIEEIISYVNEKVNKQMTVGSSVVNLADMLFSVECIKIYMGALGTCIGYLKHHPKLAEFQLQLLTVIGQFLAQTPKEFAKLASMQCLATLTQHVKFNSQKVDDNYVKLLNECIMAVLGTTFKVAPRTSSSDISLTSDDIRKLTVAFSVQKWNAITNILTVLSEISSEGHLYIQNSRTIFTHCVEALEVSNFAYTHILLQALRLVLVFLVQEVKDQSELVSLVDHCFNVAWIACSDQIFRSVPLQCQFLSVAFQPALIRIPCLSESDTSPLKKYYHKTLEVGEYTFVIANCLAYYCTLAWSNPQNLPIFKLYLPVLDKLMLFGPNRKGLKEGEEMDDALEYDAYIREYLNDFTSSEMAVSQPDIYVRARCLWALRSLEHHIQAGQIPNASEVRDFLVEILLMLLNIQKQVTIKLYRCWSDHHKRVIRLWQTITSMVPMFSTMFSHVTEETQDKIATDLWAVLQFHNHKSVRQYIDLFAIHFLRRFDKTRNDKLIKYLSHFNERSDVLHSVITIAGYVMMSLNLQQEVDRALFNKLVNLVMGHATSHHPTIRRMGQVIIDKAVQYYKQFQGIPPLNDSIMTYFLYIQENEECRKYLVAKYHSTLLQHMNSNMKDSDINVEFVYHTLTDEDSFPLSECMTQELYDRLVTHSMDKMTSQPTSENLPRVSAEQDEVDKEVVHSSEDFQKKIIPWEHTLAYDDSILRETLMIEKSRQEIIIVASLIDRVPNLAGLTRTAEIFNVTALVVPNKKIVIHPQFQEISVSAEKWVPMIEVPEEGLKGFLEEKKGEGWTLLGVEQTAKSINLTQFEFPQKCVLVLGKEKEGIPVEFLQLLDDCIIIPQLGVIRSLNVHVSGSIMMFEYTRQQLVRSQGKQT